MLPPTQEEPLDAAPKKEPDAESEPWVLRLGNFLSGKKSAESNSDETPWSVRLGTYLNENKPGPWSLIANKKPHDPMVLRLGTFLNETKPIKALHRDGTDEGEENSKDPMVLRLGNFLNGSSSQQTPASGFDGSADMDVPGASVPTVTPPAVPASSAGATPSEGPAAVVGALGPAWTRGEIERPAGEKDMGGWTAAVYTAEQQARLGVDELGKPVSSPPAAPAAEPPAPAAVQSDEPAAAGGGTGAPSSPASEDLR